MSKRFVAVSAVLTIAAAAAVVVGAEPTTASPSPTAAPGGSYVALMPQRILATQSGLGAPKGATQQVTLRTAGVGGIPTSGVSAVAVNLAVSAPSAAGYLVAYPAGTSRPGTTNLNYVANQTVDAMAIVPVNSSGAFTIDSQARAQLTADVFGYFTTAATASSTAGRFTALAPTRIMDTRSHLGAGKPGPGGTVTVQVTGTGGIPASGVSAVVVNTIVLGPTATGYVSGYPTGIQRPGTATIRFDHGATRSNRAILPIGQDGKISFYNATGTTNIVVDVNGYFGANGSYYLARTTATRLLDSRSTARPWSPSANATNNLGVTVDASAYLNEIGRTPSLTDVAPTTAVWLTLTAVRPTTSGYTTAHPSTTARYPYSDLNAAAAKVTNNAAMVLPGTDGNISIYASVAQQVDVDLDGYFVAAPAVPTPAGLWAWGVSGYDSAFQVNSTPGLKAVVPGPVDFALGADGHLRGWIVPYFTNDHLRSSRANLADGGGSVKQLVGSQDTTYVLHNDGTVDAMGWNDYAEFGDGTQSDQAPVADWSITPPYTVGETGGRTQISDVTLIGAASHNGYAVKSDGTVWAWGNGVGLGNGTTTDSYVPVQVSGLTNVVSIAGNIRLTYAVGSDGQLWRWGYLPSSSTYILTPQQVTTACAKGVSVAADSYGAWELCDDGSVWQLYRDRQSTDTTVHLAGPGAITAISAAPSPGVQALNADGTVWRLPSVTATQFVPVYGLSGITAIGGGTYTSYALR